MSQQRDTLAEAVRAAIKQVVEEEVGREADAAAERVRAAVKDRTAAIALRVLEHVEFSRDAHRLFIEVKHSNNP